MNSFLFFYFVVVSFAEDGQILSGFSFIPYGFFFPDIWEMSHAEFPVAWSYVRKQPEIRCISVIP